MTKTLKEITEENRKLKELLYKSAIAIIHLLEQHTNSEASSQLLDHGLSANENAISVLENIGVVKDNRIDFDKLERVNFDKIESHFVDTNKMEARLENIGLNVEVRQAMDKLRFFKQIQKKELYNMNDSEESLAKLRACDRKISFWTENLLNILEIQFGGKNENN